MCSSVSTYLPASNPRSSRPSCSVCGVRPSATSTSSASTVAPSEISTLTVPSGWRWMLLAFWPMRMSAPSACRASVTSAHANSSSRGSSRRSPSTSVTWVPSDW